MPPFFTYFKKAKKTAAIIKTNATIWFHCKVPVWNTVTAIVVNTVRDMASWIIFNCIRLNGPPLMRLPMLFAGIMKLYSKSAMPQEARMTKINGQSVLICISLSFKFPYHANVMNTLEQQRRRIVIIPAFIFRCQVLGVRCQVSGVRGLVINYELQITRENLAPLARNKISYFIIHTS